MSRKDIVDSTGTFALRTLQSGMHSGITSPARPWFRLTTFDPDLKDFAPVKEYLAAVERRMREVFQALISTTRSTLAMAISASSASRSAFSSG